MIHCRCGGGAVVPAAVVFQGAMPQLVRDCDYGPVDRFLLVTMLLRQVYVALTIAVLSEAAPAPIKHVLHEKRERHALDWVKGDRVEADAVLPVRIGLTQNNLDKGYEYLMEVYVVCSMEVQMNRANRFSVHTLALPSMASIGLLMRSMICLPHRQMPWMQSVTGFMRLALTGPVSSTRITRAGWHLMPMLTKLKASS